MGRITAGVKFYRCAAMRIAHAMLLQYPGQLMDSSFVPIK